MSYECSCDDGDPPEVFEATYVKAARKDYRCDECCGSIKRGDSYRRDFYILCGDALTVRMCSPCVELLNWARISVPCFCYTIGELHGNVRDMAEQVDIDVPGVLAEFQQRMDAIKALHPKEPSP